MSRRQIGDADFAKGVSRRSGLIAGCAATIVLLPAVGLAADLPSRRAPIVPPPAIVSWDGFYAGLNAGSTFGYGLVTTTGTPISSNPAGVANGAPATLSALTAVLGSNTRGAGGQFIGGGQLGYNYQYQSAYILGVEADIQGLAGSSKTPNAVTTSSFAPYGFPLNNYGSTASFTQRLDYLGTVRGRIGYLITPSVLVYATGGLAYGGAHVGSSFSIQQTFVGDFANITPPIFGGASASKTAIGSTVGGGFEWMFWSNWSAKLEYLYYDLGSFSAGVPLTQIVNNPPAFVNSPYATAQAKTSARFNGSIVHVGLNYHFN